MFSYDFPMNVPMSGDLCMQKSSLATSPQTFSWKRFPEKLPGHKGSPALTVLWGGAPAPAQTPHLRGGLRPPTTPLTVGLRPPQLLVIHKDLIKKLIKADIKGGCGGAQPPQVNGTLYVYSFWAPMEVYIQR